MRSLFEATLIVAFVAYGIIVLLDLVFAP